MTITFYPGTSATVTYTGTVNRDGLGILDAFLYDDFSTASVIELHAADSARAFQNSFDAKLINGVETARNQLGKILGALDFGPRTNTVVDIIA